MYKETGQGISYPQQWAYFRDLRRKNPETLGKVNATSMQQLLRRLDKAFQAFFRRLRAGEKPGFPRFKSASRFRSMEFRHGDGCRLRFSDRVALYVQNVGEIKIKYHRDLPQGAVVKHVVLKKSLGKWYVYLQVEVPYSEPPIHQGPAVGIDMGLKSLLALSDGQLIDNPRWFRASQRRLRVAQRRLFRRRKGSRRWRKAAFQVAKIHEHIKNQRLDFWHKVSRALADRYSLIALENLTLDFMLKNRHLALSAHDAGLGIFRKLLEYKAADAGALVVYVNPASTSQVCSGCGDVVEKGLSVRIHRCTSCGLVIDRDINAARNILSLALQARSDGAVRAQRSG